jgi:tetratricopeptide (TPR) repeat protein
MTDNHSQAIKYLEEAIKIKPDNLKAHYNLGLVYEIMGRYQDAASEYRKVALLNPDHPEIYNNLAWALIESKRYIEALVPLKKSIKLNPNSKDTYYSMGWVYGELKRYDEAIDALKKTLQIDPNHSEAEAHLNTMKRYLKEVTEQSLDKPLNAVTSALHDKPEIIVTP